MWDDLARGVVFCLDNYDEYEHIICGAGWETTICDLVESVGRATGLTGKIVLETTKPDAPRKLMDSSRILAWKGDFSRWRHRGRPPMVFGEKGWRYNFALRNLCGLTDVSRFAENGPSAAAKLISPGSKRA